MKPPRSTSIYHATSLFFLLALFLLPLLMSFDWQAGGDQVTPPQTSRIEQDTALAKNLARKGRLFLDSARYDSSLTYYKQAAALLNPYLEGNRDTVLWKLYLNWGNEMGSCYGGKADYKKSLEQYEITLKQGKEYLGEENPILADSYNGFGTTYYRQGAFEAALENYQQALKIRINLFGENHRGIAMLYSNIGSIYENRAEYQSALDYFFRASNIFINLLGEDSPDLAVIYNNMGMVYRRQGAYESALEYYRKTLKIDAKTYGDNHPYVAGTYNNIGLVFYDQGLFDAALENFYRALPIKIEALGTDHPSTGSTYQNIGAVYAAQGALESALDNYQKVSRIYRAVLGEKHYQVGKVYVNIGIVYNNQGAHKDALKSFQNGLRILLGVFGENHFEVAGAYANVGKVYYLQGEYKLALESYQKALSINQQIFSENHPNVAKSYKNIGIVYAAQGKSKQALAYYSKALKTHRDVWGNQHPDIASNYNNIALIYAKQGLEEIALENYQKALMANSVNFEEQTISTNPTIHNTFLSEKELLVSLARKANTLFSLYKRQTSDLSNLRLAHQTYQLAMELATKLRQGYKRQEDKAELLKNTFAVHEGVIQSALSLYGETQQDSFLHQAFIPFEKSRSLLLLENIRSTEAKTFAGIPEELLEQEVKISIRLAFCERSLFEETLKKEKADSTRLALWQEEVFGLRQTKDSLTQVFEHQYPAYFRLKYDFQPTSIADLQKLLPDEQSALLEYFVGDSSLYVFVIDKNDYRCLEIKKDFPLEKWVTQLQRSIYQYHLLPVSARSEKQYQNFADTLVNFSRQLHERIFTPVAEQYDLPEKLIISPDGVLGYLPFELLLKEVPQDNYAFRNHAYLLRDHQISYTYSATLLQEMKNKETNRTTGNFLAFAPSFNSSTSTSQQINDIRSGLGALEYNIPEVEKVHNLIGGKIYTGGTATKAQFLQEASQYNIIHLATHGKANDLMGDYAFLAFAENSDTLNYERLYNRDLYSLQLNADMVVLSACETGIGELKKGEGIISLARGFSYAGAKSIITSLWSVNDAKTEQLMQSFYTYIRAGFAKDEALRQAKLDYLGSQTSANAHPFFWASFISIGDMAPIPLNTGLGWPTWVGIGLLFIGLSWIFLRRKK